MSKIQKQQQAKIKQKIIRFLVFSTVLGIWVQIKHKFFKKKNKNSCKPSHKYHRKPGVKWVHPRAKAFGNKMVVLQLNLGKNILDSKRN